MGTPAALERERFANIPAWGSFLTASGAELGGESSRLILAKPSQAGGYMISHCTPCQPAHVGTVLNPDSGEKRGGGGGVGIGLQCFPDWISHITDWYGVGWRCALTPISQPLPDTASTAAHDTWRGENDMFPNTSPHPISSHTPVSGFRQPPNTDVYTVWSAPTTR